MESVNYIYWKRLVLVHLKRYYKNMYIIALSCFLTHFYLAWKGTLRPEAAIKMHFSISLFCTCSEILWKIPMMECNFSKFACNALQLWTTAAEELNFITALINAELQLLQITSRKLLLSLEAVVRRYSSNYCTCS